MDSPVAVISSSPIDLADLKTQLDAWRQSHRKRARIPDHFYTAAVSLLDRHCRVRDLPTNSSTSSLAQKTRRSDTCCDAHTRRPITLAVLTTRSRRPCAAPCSRCRLTRALALRARRRFALDTSSVFNRLSATRSPLRDLFALINEA